MKTLLIIIGFSIVGYFLGNFSFARIATKIKDKNINSTNSGNPGTMNMVRNYGIVLGALTLFFDAIKGAIPSLIAFLLLGGVGGGANALIGLYCVGLCAIIGHIYPVFYKFKGGKGIATTIGVFFVADPLTAGFLLLFIILVIFFIKIGSLSSLFLILSFAIIETCKSINQNVYILILLYSIVLLDMFAHRENILRLFNGNERETDIRSSIEKDLVKIKIKKEKKLIKAHLKSKKINEKLNKIVNDDPEVIENKTIKLEKQLYKIKNKEIKIEKRYLKKANKINKKASTKFVIQSESNI